MNVEQEIGLLPIASSVEQTQPATASMYWPLMTPSCLAKTKPSIRGAAGTDGSCVNPPWTHQSFQPLPNSSNCHIQTYGQSQLMQSVQNIFNPDGAYKMCIFKCGKKNCAKNWVVDRISTIWLICRNLAGWSKSSISQISTLFGVTN